VAASDVVITGIGVVSPIGIGREPFWSGLCAGRSGIGRIGSFDPSWLPVQIAGEVRDFDPKLHIANRKALKVMCRDAQLGVAAAGLAYRDAGLSAGADDPERFGIVLGADRNCTSMEDSESTYRGCMVNQHFDFSRWGTAGMAGTFPLSFLKVLPNMIGSHISIVLDARGPNNTIHQAEVSGLLAVDEAARVIQRGSADVMLAGGASSQLNPYDCIRHCVMGILSRRRDDPAAAVRPFEAQRDGQVWGEGAAVMILESRRHAEARSATVLARLLGSAVTYQCRGSNHMEGTGLRQAMRLALRRAELDAGRVGHLNAHGLSTICDDRLEAQAIHDVAPAVPVTALKSYFGNLGAAGSAVQMAASVLSFGAALIPPTLNYEQPDPSCPLEIVRGGPARASAATALLVSWTPIGQAAAIVLAGPD